MHVLNSEPYSRPMPRGLRLMRMMMASSSSISSLLHSHANLEWCDKIKLSSLLCGHAAIADQTSTRTNAKSNSISNTIFCCLMAGICFVGLDIQGYLASLSTFVSVGRTAVEKQRESIKSGSRDQTIHTLISNNVLVKWF